jgi:hypothetical protein
MTPANEPTPADRSELAAVKNQLFILLTALVIISGTVTFYLYYQARMAGYDLAQASRLDAAITHNEAALREFVSKLEAYGKQHPDFQMLLNKYRVPQPPAAAPATAPAAPKK